MPNSDNVIQFYLQLDDQMTPKLRNLKSGFDTMVAAVEGLASGMVTSIERAVKDVGAALGALEKTKPIKVPIEFTVGKMALGVTAGTLMGSLLGGKAKALTQSVNFKVGELAYEQASLRELRTSIADFFANKSRPIPLQFNTKVSAFNFGGSLTGYRRTLAEKISGPGGIPLTFDLTNFSKEFQTVVLGTADAFVARIAAGMGGAGGSEKTAPPTAFSAMQGIESSRMFSRSRVGLPFGAKGGALGALGWAQHAQETYSKTSFGDVGEGLAVKSAARKGQGPFADWAQTLLALKKGPGFAKGGYIPPAINEVLVKVHGDEVIMPLAKAEGFLGKALQAAMVAMPFLGGGLTGAEIKIIVIPSPEMTKVAESLTPFVVPTKHVAGVEKLTGMKGTPYAEGAEYVPSKWVPPGYRAAPGAAGFRRSGGQQMVPYEGYWTKSTLKDIESGQFTKETGREFGVHQFPMQKGADPRDLAGAKQMLSREAIALGPGDPFAEMKTVIDAAAEAGGAWNDIQTLLASSTGDVANSFQGLSNTVAAYQSIAMNANVTTKEGIQAQGAAYNALGHLSKRLKTYSKDIAKTEGGLNDLSLSFNGVADNADNAVEGIDKLRESQRDARQSSQDFARSLRNLVGDMRKMIPIAMSIGGVKVVGRIDAALLGTQDQLANNSTAWAEYRDIATSVMAETGLAIEDVGKIMTMAARRGFDSRQEMEAFTRTVAEVAVSARGMGADVESAAGMAGYNLQRLGISVDDMRVAFSRFIQSSRMGSLTLRDLNAMIGENIEWLQVEGATSEEATARVSRFAAAAQTLSEVMGTAAQGPRGAQDLMGYITSLADPETWKGPSGAVMQMIVSYGGLAFDEVLRKVHERDWAGVIVDVTTAASRVQGDVIEQLGTRLERVYGVSHEFLQQMQMTPDVATRLQASLEAIDAAGDSTRELTQAMERYKETVEGAAAIMKGTFKQAIDDAFRALTKHITDMLNLLSMGLRELHEKAPGVSKAAGTATGLVGTAFGLTLLGGVLKKLGATLKGFGRVLKFLGPAFVIFEIGKGFLLDFIAFADRGDTRFKEIRGFLDSVGLGWTQMDFYDVNADRARRLEEQKQARETNRVTIAVEQGANAQLAAADALDNFVAEARRKDRPEQHVLNELSRLFDENLVAAQRREGEMVNAIVATGEDRGEIRQVEATRLMSPLTRELFNVFRDMRDLRPDIATEEWNSLIRLALVDAAAAATAAAPEGAAILTPEGAARLAPQIFRDTLAGLGAGLGLGFGRSVEEQRDALFGYLRASRHRLVSPTGPQDPLQELRPQVLRNMPSIWQTLELQAYAERERGMAAGYPEGSPQALVYERLAYTIDALRSLMENRFSGDAVWIEKWDRINDAFVENYASLVRAEGGFDVITPDRRRWLSQEALVSAMVAHAELLTEALGGFGDLDREQRERYDTQRNLLEERLNIQEELEKQARARTRAPYATPDVTPGKEDAVFTTAGGKKLIINADSPKVVAILEKIFDVMSVESESKKRGSEMKPNPFLRKILTGAG